MVTKLERENNTIFYLHNAWANSPDGTAGFTLEESEDAAYIGNCISMSSAEVLNPSSYNWIAVEFEAVEESDTAELTELGEDVPEDPEDEDDDYSYEDYMDGAVQAAADTATTAQESADIAQQKAEEATASAALAQQKAEEATASAAEAKTAADTAREKAEAATADAATAKQKAEEATSSAALAQQKAESATAAAETAHSAAQSATSDARTAGIAAATAQAAAESAQGDIDDQKKYFYHDKLGAHVLDAAGGAYRTDIKSDGVQIIQTATETPIAKYGETSTIGATDGNHIIISDDSIQAKNGDAESLKISLTPDRPIAGYGVDFDGSTVAQRVQNSETITIICQLGEDAISVDTAFLAHESIGGTDLIIDNSKNWIQYVLNTNNVTITIDGSDTEAKAVQWEKFFQLVIRYVPVRQYTSRIECDNLTAIGDLKVGNRINASVAELEGVYIGSDVYIGKYAGNDRTIIRYLDESGKRADLVQVIKGDGFLELTTGKVKFHPRWWRWGNIVQMEVGTQCAGQVASGANIAEGFVTGVPKPITKSGVRAVSYYGNNANISNMGSDGTFYARNAGADSLKNGNDCIGGFTYITDGTML